MVHSVKTVACAVALAAGGAFAATWTGSEDGFWTNRNNWAENAVPRRYLDSSGAETGSYGEIASFTAALSGNAVTAIDLDGLVSIGGVMLTGGAALPVYVFGDASGEQVLAIEHLGAFSAADVAEAPVPTLRCRLGLGAKCDVTASTSHTFVTNNSAKVFHVGQFGYWPTFRSAHAQMTLNICGTGNVQLDGRFVGTTSPNQTVAIYFLNPRTIVNCDLDPERRHIRKIRPGQDVASNYSNVTTYPDKRRYIEITAGGVLPISCGSTSRGFDCVYATEFCGDGILQLSCGKTGGSEPYFIHGDLRFSCTLDVAEQDNKGPGSSGVLSDMWLLGSSSSAYSFYDVYVTGANIATGIVTAIGHNNSKSDGTRYPRLVVDSIGKVGESGRLGTGPAIRLGNGTRLVYTGTGEETDRTVILANGSDTAVGVLEHNGTGVFEWSGVVSQQCQEVTLALGGTSAAGAVFSGVLAENPMGEYADPVLNLEKRDAGTWTLTAANTYVGSTTVKAGTLAIGPAGSIASSSGVTLAGGALVYENAPTPRTEALANVTLSASTTITLGKNRSLTLAALPTRSDAETLDIRAYDYDSLLKVGGVTAGPAPEWLTLNGETAVFDANGVLNPVGLTRWSKGEDGDWSESASWSDGVPTVEKIAYVGADTVTIDVTGATAGRLFLSGAATRLEIPSGSSYVAEHATAVPPEVPDAEAIGQETFAVDGGATLAVDGGALTLANATGLTTVRSRDVAVTSRIEVANGGSLSYTATAARGRMTIGVGGELTAMDASVRAVGSQTLDGGLLTDGGRMVFSGASQLQLGSAGTSTDIRAFGTGETRFEDSTTFGLQPAGTARVAPEAAGEMAEVTFAGTSAWDATTVTMLPIGGTTGGCAVLNVDTSFATDLSIGHYAYVGANYGVGELNLSRGKVMVGRAGMTVGCCQGKSASGKYMYTYADCAPTGVVRQTGGKLTFQSYGALSGYGWDDTQPIGLVLGAGTSTKNTTHGNVFSGRYELSGGTLSAQVVHFLVGAGHATGEFVQTGGTAEFNVSTYTLYHDTDGDGVTDTAVSSTNLATVIGLAGGAGSVIVSNGSFRANSVVYVGGAQTNVFMQMPIYTSGKWSYPTKRFINYPFDRHGATGSFTVAGGTVKFGQSLVLGADGTGTLEVVGTDGTITVANGLVLSNNTQSVVRFVTGENSVTPVKVAGKLTIRQGAQLQVDASALEKTSVKLFEFGELEGAFDPADITVVGQKNPGDCRLQVRGNELWMKLPGKGMLMIVR